MLTAPVFRTKQIALLQAHEISQAIHWTFPGFLKRMENLGGVAGGTCRSFKVTYRRGGFRVHFLHIVEIFVNESSGSYGKCESAS